MATYNVKIWLDGNYITNDFIKASDADEAREEAKHRALHDGLMLPSEKPVYETQRLNW